MINMDQLDIASVIMDFAAVCILIGVLIHTSIYRKRGHREDKLFFYMEILTMLMAISDAVTYVLDESSVPGAAILSMGCNTVFHVCFELIFGLYLLFFMCGTEKGKVDFDKRWVYYMALSFAGVLMVLINIFTGFLYIVDPADNAYKGTTVYNMVYIAPAVYLLFSMMIIAKEDVRLLIIMLVLTVARALLIISCRGVSAGALMISMLLVFTQIYVMNKPFYEEADE